MQLVIHSPQDLTYQNQVPFVVWCYWEGEAMSGNRLLSFEYLSKNIGVPICLITPENIQQFIKPQHPFPEVYKYLSIVHRSDYIRAYLLHHYGGAWHDVKATTVSYASCWKEFEDEKIWIIGKPEIAKGAAQVLTSDGKYIPDYYKDLIAVPSWIGRPQTPLSSEILQGIEHILAENATTLATNPAKHPRERKLVTKNIVQKIVYPIKFFLQKRSLYYPLEWTLFGNVFHPAILKYKNHVSRNLPVDDIKNAGIYHRG